MVQNDQISLQELTIKCESKKELYNVLRNDCDAYLSPLQFPNAGKARWIIIEELNKFS